MSSLPPLDSELLSRLRRPDSGALEAAVRDHARVLYCAARGMGFREEEFEDLVQDVFVTLLETLDRFEGRWQIRTWLFGILHNKARERRRDESREEQNDPLDEVFVSRFDPEGNWMRPPEDLDRLIESKKIDEAIRHCLKGLPANQREVFVLREMEELQTREICKIMGVTVTHMSVLIHRARNRMRERIEGRGWRRAG